MSYRKLLSLIKEIPEQDVNSPVIWDVEQGEDQLPQEPPSLVSRMKSYFWALGNTVEDDLNARTITPEDKRYMKELMEVDGTNDPTVTPVSFAQNPLGAVYNGARALAPKRWTEPMIPKLMTIIDQTGRHIMGWDGEEFVLYDDSGREAGYVSHARKSEGTRLVYRGQLQRCPKSFKLEYVRGSVTFTPTRTLISFHDGHHTVIQSSRQMGFDCDTGGCLLIALVRDLPQAREHEAET